MTDLFTDVLGAGELGPLGPVPQHTGTGGHRGGQGTLRHEIHSDSGVAHPIIEVTDLYSAIGDSDGSGFLSITGRMDADIVRARPDIYRQRAVWLVFHAETGRLRWAGWLLDPEISGGVAELSGRGWGTMLSRAVDRLLYQSRDPSQWQAADSQDFGYDTDPEISASVEGRRIILASQSGAHYFGGEQSGVVFWAPDNPIGRIALDAAAERLSSDYVLELMAGTGPSGQLQRLRRWSFGDSLLASIDYTLPDEDDFDLVELRMRRTHPNAFELEEATPGTNTAVVTDKRAAGDSRQALETTFGTATAASRWSKTVDVSDMLGPYDVVALVRAMGSGTYGLGLDSSVPVIHDASGMEGFGEEILGTVVVDAADTSVVLHGYASRMAGSAALRWDEVWLVPPPVRNEVQHVALSGFGGTDSFKLTYAGNESAAVVRGTNFDDAGIKARIEAIPGFTGTVQVSNVDDDGFDVEFHGAYARTDVSMLSVTSPSGCSGVVGERLKGIAASKAARHNARPFRLELVNVRVNAIAPDDDFTTSDLARDIAARIGASDHLIEDSSTPILPVDVQEGTFADVLYQAAAIEDYRPRVVGQRPSLDFATWGSHDRIWRIVDPEQQPHLIPRTRYNVVRVPFRYPGGARSVAEVVADPDPLNGDVVAYDLSLDDPLPLEDAARSLGERVLGWLEEARAGGHMDLGDVLDPAGRRWPALAVVDAGDVLEFAGGRRLRLKSFHAQDNAPPSVEFDASAALLDAFLAQRRRRIALGRTSVGRTKRNTSHGQLAAPAGVTLDIRVAHPKRNPNYRALARWDEVTEDVDGRTKVSVAGYIAQLRYVDADSGDVIVDDDGKPVIRRHVVHTPEDGDDKTEPGAGGEDGLHAWFNHLHHVRQYKVSARVRAFSHGHGHLRKGRWSAWTTPVLPVAGNPPEPENVELDNSIDTVGLRWDGPTDPDNAAILHRSIDYFEVVVANDEDFSLGIRKFTQRNTRFRHPVADPDAKFMRVRSVGDDGSVSDWVYHDGTTIPPVAGTGRSDVLSGLGDGGWGLDVELLFAKSVLITQRDTSTVGLKVQSAGPSYLTNLAEFLNDSGILVTVIGAAGRLASLDYSSWLLLGDTQDRIRIDPDLVGLLFGPGDLAPDVSLYREDVSLLATDGSMHVIGDLTVDGTIFGEPTSGAALLPIVSGAGRTTGDDADGHGSDDGTTYWVRNTTDGKVYLTGRVNGSWVSSEYA